MPLIVCWPQVVEANTVSNIPVTTPDLFPTIAGIAGVATDRSIDGETLLPLLRGTGSLARKAIFWHYPHYYPNADKLTEAGEPFSNPWHRGWITPFSAIREDRYKLIEYLLEDRVELYDLQSDISETTDLADALSNKAEELQAKLNLWRKSVNAQMPHSNPNADPKRADRWTVTED